MFKNHREIFRLRSMSPIIHYLKGCNIKLRSVNRVRCLWLCPGSLAKRVAREGGSTRSARLEICVVKSAKAGLREQEVRCTEMPRAERRPAVQGKRNGEQLLASSWAAAVWKIKNNTGVAPLQFTLIRSQRNRASRAKNLFCTRELAASTCAHPAHTPERFFLSCTSGGGTNFPPRSTRSKRELQYALQAPNTQTLPVLCHPVLNLKMKPIRSACAFVYKEPSDGRHHFSSLWSQTGPKLHPADKTAVGKFRVRM
jgi:hypothetical protein